MPALPPGRRVPEAPSGGLVAKTSRSSWIPGSYASPLSKKPHAFLRLWKNKDFKAESMTKVGSLNFSQFVEGRRWWPWAREGLEEVRVFAGDEPCNGAERCRASARLYALQSVRN
jgi:hypothetical protein